MAKPRTIFFCSSCGASSPKWLGKCPHCGEWNTYQEELIQKETATEEKRRSWAAGNGKAESPKAVPLKDVQTGRTVRLGTPDQELNRVLGGDGGQDWIPERPKGMRQRTYDRIADRLDGYIDAADAEWSRGAMAFMVRRGWRPAR